MIVLEGARALSPFRRDRLQARLNAIAPALRIVDAWHGYWIDPEADREISRVIALIEGVRSARAQVEKIDEIGGGGDTNCSDRDIPRTARKERCR